MPSRLPKRRKPTPREAGELADAAKRDDAEIRACDLAGLKFFEKIRPLLDSLHDIGTARDKSGNCELHMDQYGVLMWMFNPTLTSLRGLQQASTLADVQKRFGVGRASLGSLSESVSIFDPEPLKQIAATLATEVPSPDPSKFAAIGKQLTAVPAELIAEAYRLRWLIELFFRMIKQLLRCRHLLSTKSGGVEIQMYLAIIACLLILIYTGGQPNKRT